MPLSEVAGVEIYPGAHGHVIGLVDLVVRRFGRGFHHTQEFLVQVVYRYPFTSLLPFLLPLPRCRLRSPGIGVAPFQEPRCIAG